MNIKFYFAAIILACLSCGFILEYFIVDKQLSVESISNESISDQFIIAEIESFQQELYQYFISVDLILGSGESYLIDGAIKKGKLLSYKIDKFKLYSNIIPNLDLLIQSENDIKEVNNILAKSNNTQSNDREIILNNLLLKSDLIAQRLTYSVSELINQARGMADIRINELIKRKKNAKYTRIVGAFIFGLFLFILWIWAYKRVCNPIYKLRELTELSMGGANKFDGIDKGPKEIIELSNSLSVLTNSLSHQASHDSLTDLYNRRELERKLKCSIDNSSKSSSSSNDILCFLDLDQFKIINDTCGHIAGDELLKNVSDVIKNGVRRSDFVSRVGGDEFCFILFECDMDTALKISNKIRNDIENIRFLWNENVFRISACVGLTEIDSQHITADETLNVADTACTVAKELGRNRVHAFNKSDTELARRKTEMSFVNQIHLALEEDRFILYRQDIIPLKLESDSTSHFEVLVRMISNNGQVISPYSFLPIMERYHLATKLDEWVIHNTFTFLTKHIDELKSLGICNINLSGQSFSNLNMADYIIDQLIETNMPANKICFEITETAAITDIANAQNFIARLKEHGCLFALDDFGSGLSSFQYLKNLAVDFVKIDGAFVKNMDTDKIDRATVKSINDIAKQCGKQTVAEFVENIDIVKELEDIGVDFAQGYHYNAPIPMYESDHNIQKASNW